MKITIENYRGFEITFDTENEKFSYELDNTSWHFKQSFAACKKGIDEYIKANHTFKPFKVMQTSNMFKDAKEVTIIGIRKDGRFIYENGGKKEQISDYNEKDWFLYDKKNEPHFAAIAILNSEIDELKAKIKTEESKLKKVYLNTIKANYLPPQ